MSNLRCFTLVVLVVGLLASCGAPAAVPSTATPAQATATVEEAAEETTAAESIAEPASFPLSEPGPYRVGVRQFSAMDANRDGREVGIRVWYPAVWPEGEGRKRTAPQADPDRSSAPYPLILSSAKVGAILAPYVVTHGFVWAGVTRIDTYDVWNPS